MDLYTRDADDLSDIKKAILRGYMNDDDDSDDNETSDVDEELDDEELNEDEITPGQKDVDPTEEEVEELGSAMRVIFAEESIIPVPENLVSAMKGSREKQGQTPRILKVNWAPDVYDPEPSMLLPARGEKQKKSKKNKEIDEDSFDTKKKGGKKGQKGDSRGGSGGSGKDKKQLKKAARGSDRGHKSRGAFSDDF